MVERTESSSWEACRYGPISLAYLMSLHTIAVMIPAASKLSAKGAIALWLLLKCVQMSGRLFLIVLHSGDFQEPKYYKELTTPLWIIYAQTVEYVWKCITAFIILARIRLENGKCGEQCVITKVSILSIKINYYIF